MSGTTQPASRGLCEARFRASRKRPKKPRKVVRDVLADAGDYPETSDALARQLGLDEGTLGLHIDRSLATQVWNGTRFEDRTLHLSSRIAQDVAGQIEQSLLQQEGYEEFEKRLLKSFGLDDIKEPGGWLAKADRQMRQEVKLAWNTTMVAANQDADTVLVWRAVLDDATTPECWYRHSQLIDEIGTTPPAHWGCRCDVITLSNPESNVESIAILDEMRAERDAMGEPESARECGKLPGRLTRFRELRRVVA